MESNVDIIDEPVVWCDYCRYLHGAFKASAPFVVQCAECGAKLSIDLEEQSGE